MKRISILFLFTLFLLGCSERSYNLDYEHEGLLYLDKSDLPKLDLNQEIYVPAYSDIFYETQEKRTYLTVILSLRNISFTDTLYFDRIDYYSSNGKLLKKYIDKVLMLRPMESMEYIVASQDRKGGPGANFVVSYMGKEGLKNPPLIETIMMGNLDNYRFSFSSRGTEIKK